MGGVDRHIDMTRSSPRENENVGGKANIIDILKQEFLKGNFMTIVTCYHSNYNL